MDAAELARWTRFAGKGGIGKCTAMQDCVAERAEDLMFLKDDEITVLLQLPEQEGVYLGYCEGVVGRFQGSDVHFHSKLKKPVITKRASTAASPSAASVASSKPSPVSKTPSPVVSNLQTSSVRDSDASVFRVLVSSPSPSAHLRTSLGPHRTGLTTESSRPPSPSTLEDEPFPPTIVTSSVSIPAAGSAPSVQATQSNEINELLGTQGSKPSILCEVGSSARVLTASPESQERLDVPDVVVLSIPPEASAIPSYPSSSATPSFPPPTSLSTSSSADRTFEISEPSTRISVAMSDGEVGIGLSLLQDIANGGDGDDWSMTSGERDTPDVTRGRSSIDSFGDSTAENHYTSTVSFPLPPPPPIDTATAQRHRSSSHISSPASVQRSQSDYGEYWEGASDIYDDYRYSRYSMASRMSVSQSSNHTPSIASEVPPMPRPSMDRAPSLDSQYSFNTQSSKLSSRSRVMSSPNDPSVTAVAAVVENYALDSALVSRGRERPAPIQVSAATSPLLHTSFASPYPSPGINSASSSVSTAPSSSSYTSISGGAASALRLKLENGRTSPHPVEGAPSELDSADDGKTVGRAIVVEDDEEISMPSTVSEETSRLDDSVSSSMQSVSMSLEHVSMPPELPVALRAGNPLSSSQPNLISPPSQQLPLPQETHPPLQLQPVLRPRRTLSIQPHPGLQSSRTSLFLPHPNAPKASPTSPGPMYSRTTSQAQHPNSSSSGSVIDTLHKAASLRYSPNGDMRRTTIYGRCDHDLVSSIGPVPISFSTDPFPPIPSDRNGSVTPLNVQRRGTLPPPSTNTRQGSPPIPQAGISSSPHGRPGEVGQSSTPSSGNVIPRANFFPKAQTARPRSRSFSGFNSQYTEVPLPVEGSPGGSKPIQIPSVRSSMARASSASATSSSTSLSQKTSVSPHTSLRSSHAPSPLSLPQNNSLASLRPPSIRSPTSPLSFSAFSNPMSTSALSSKAGLRHAVSSSALNSGVPLSPLATARPPIPSGNFGPADSEPAALSSPVSLAQSSPVLESRASISSHSRGATSESSPPAWTDMPNRGSVDTDIDARSQMASPPPLGTSPSSRSPPLARNTSLRSKLSLPNLRGKNSIGGLRQDETSSISSREPGIDAETVQVQDMDFELVRPNLPQFASGRTSEDSTFIGRDTMVSDLKVDSLGLPRSESPANSTLSTAPLGPRPPTAASERSSASASKTARSPDPQASMDAHRQRELKWMSVMSSTPASQAKKSKKIRKLLLEGVPSSVRYLVWAHLTDSKAKGMPGLYVKLSKRDKVAASNDIDRDIRKFFMDQPHMQNTQGSLGSVLQAYLTMVPDIQYHAGLTFIAGHLLLLSPEEDAFWIFVSLMDSYLRPYFSLNAIQMEVDGSLFSKAVESNDPAVAKKVFIDMGVSPSTICRPWFSAIFAETLPIEYLHRVWDIFLYEGLAFLFRVGLAIFSCCRRQLLDANGEQAALLNLLHPPPNSLPPTADAFITLAFSVKLKDDDIRKQRIKMEAQVKRQTQARVSAPGGSISLPRS